MDQATYKLPAVQVNIDQGTWAETRRRAKQLTREQAMEVTELSERLEKESADVTLLRHEDIAKASSGAMNSIAQNVEAGLITGRSETELAPKDMITRAEVAVIIERLMQQSNLV